MKFFSHFLLTLLIVVAVSPAIANANEFDIVTSGVGEIFSRRCFSCHNSHDRKGDFSLETREELNDSGYIESGNPEESYLLELVTRHAGEAPKMPKDSDPLSQSETKAIEEWIAAGAKWPDQYRISEPVIDNFDWWAFEPLSLPAVPQLSRQVESTWRENPIDLFIAERHQAKGLSPAPPAKKRELIRRVTFNLTGLPPKPEEIQLFLNDDRPDAYEQLVDRLLASPAYGEHWARRWLDVVKYADTCGYDKDKLRENAWPYRDYVIRSFNEDKHYARFIQEQIAGDALFLGEPDGILGLGFLAAGPWDFIGHVEVPESKQDGMVARNLDRDDVVSNVMNTFCSVTIQCARCHNHKFDPFTQEHYYGLQAVFAAIDRAERPYDLDPEIEKIRLDLQESLASNQAKLKEWQKDIEKAGGAELKSLREEVTRLTAAASPAKKRPEFGYHSQITKSADTKKWVQIDLGQAKDVRKITLFPCHDDFAGIGAGFGFPRCFVVTGAVREDDFASPESRVVLLDHSENDFPNPGLVPFSIDVESKPIRFIRVEAMKLAERKNDYIFALAEVQVLDSEGENLAQGARVSALDSIEAPIRWRKSNLIDGIWPVSQEPMAVQKLKESQAQLSTLLASIETEEKLLRKAELEQEIESVQQQLKKLPTGKMVYAAATHFPSRGNFHPTKGKPRTIRLLNRGNVSQPGEVVKPGRVPLNENDQTDFQLPAEHDEDARRAALAKWIANENNPLTWRSIVNRIWLGHFGEGLVASPNDFGRMGQLPTHPELLDWLALTFRDGGGSFKKLHRLIVTSQTYQQSTAHNELNAKIDGSNRFLWRMNRRRLTAEEVRDALLAVSGLLDLTPGGPGDRLFVLEHPQHSPHYQYHLFDPLTAERHRRSIYRFVVRSQPDPWMSVLDCADSSQSTPKRSETTTPLQALSLMNNKFNLFVAEKFAERLQRDANSEAEQIRRAFQLALGRSPSGDELQVLLDYTQTHGLMNSCRLILNLNEFVFVD